MDQFLCWKLKVACVATCVWIISSGSLAAIFELLDEIALAEGSRFDISGSFKSAWRSHVWEGWLATNLVMFFFHLVMIALSVLLLVAIKRFPAIYEYRLTKLYMAAMLVYLLTETGIGCYRYSWYAGNSFRLAFLIFTFLFWLVRTLFNVVAVYVLYSRIKEIDFEIIYGEKKVLSGYMNDMTAMDITTYTECEEDSITQPGRTMSPVHGMISHPAFAIS